MTSFDIENKKIQKKLQRIENNLKVISIGFNDLVKKNEEYGEIIRLLYEQSKRGITRKYKLGTNSVRERQESGRDNDGNRIHPH